MSSYYAVLTGREAVREALAEAHGHLAAGRLEEAERGYRAILRADPERGEALHGLGLVALRVNNRVEAARLMRAAIAVDLRADVYRTNLGNVLQMEGLLAEAAQEYERALTLRPDSVAALSNLGAALLGMGRAEEAELRLRRAAEVNPDMAQVWDNLGNTLQALGRAEEAVACHERAFGLAPQNAEICGNLGLALAATGRWETALKSFELGLTVDGANARMQLARAQLQLLRGDFDRGWANYEWRKRVHGIRKLPGREWRGEAIAAGDTLLLYAEQGLGDAIQFLRYVARARERLGDGVGLAVEVQPELRRLAEGIGERITVAGEELPEFAWHCSLVSLAWVLGEGRIPNEVPYLETPARRSFPAGAATLRVGLVWAGNRAHVRDRFRSMAFEALEPLWTVEGVEFHSLQLSSDEGAGRLMDATASIQDMADTAALMESLDLVIGVDTAVAHLAGALGKRVWTMLPFWPDWRWRLEREDTPWYPTMRLFRQARPGDWAEVVERVRAALVEEIARRREG